MIKLQNISKTFSPGTANAVKALQRIDLNIADKEFLVLVGSNGSGKSSLLNAIAGSFVLDEGKIFLDGTDVTSMKDYERSNFISRIFQNPLAGTAPDLSVLENFRLAALRTQSKKLHKGINNKFKNAVAEKVSILKLNLENKLEQKMGTLSGGQRQALTLIMSVMADAKIILLDEPTAALDPRSSEILMQNAQRVINEFALTAIMVTHNLKDAFQYGNRIIQMSEGIIIKDLNSEQKSKLSLLDLFGWFE
ncbi:MAG: ATP-binding cassette domain-containing protein [Bacteroidia bacterium]